MLLGMEEVMGINGVDAILRLSPLENSIQDYLPVKYRSTFSFEISEPPAKYAGAGVRSTRRTGIGFAYWARMFQVWSQGIWLHARA